MVRKNTGTYADNQNYISYADHVNNADQIYLTNSSGVQLTTGDVGVRENSTDLSMTTTTTAGDLRPVVVVPAAITGQDVSTAQNVAAAAQAWFFKAGAYVPKANVDGAVLKGEYLKLSGTAKKLTGTGVQSGSATAVPVGTCAVAEEAIGVAGQIAVTLMETQTGPETPTLFGAAIATAQTLKDRMVPYYDGANAQWAVGGSTKWFAPYTTQVNTAAAQTVLSKTIEGASIGANGALNVKARILVRNGKGTSGNLTVTLKFGGATVREVITAFAHSATATHRGYWEVELILRNLNDQAAQGHVTKHRGFGSTAIDTNSSGFSLDTGFHGAETIDTSTDQALLIEATMDAASADFQWYLIEGTVEVQYGA